MKKGFTLIETMAVLLIIGTLMNVAIPNYLISIKKAKAASIVSDIMIIRDAAISMYTETGKWPADELWGVIPSGLSGYLPGKFTFSLLPKQDVRYSFDNYIGNEKYQKQYGQFDIAISVHSKDIFILNSIKTLLIGNVISSPGFSGYSRMSYIVKDLEQSADDINEEDISAGQEDLKDEDIRK